MKITRFATIALAIGSSCLTGIGLSFNLPAQAEQVSCDSPWARDSIDYLVGAFGTYPDTVKCFYIDAGASQWTTLSFGSSESGTYQVVGECDEDCHDLDLVVYDRRGNELGRDELEDSYPIVEITDVLPGETVEVRIDMYGCSTSYCGAAIGTISP